MITLMLKYAAAQLGTPYIFGANGGGAYDCSGFVLECLKSVGFIGRGDKTAQQIYKYFKERQHPDANTTNPPAPGDLVFYGGDFDHITHIAMVYAGIRGKYLIIEAGGGGSNTTSEARAKAAGAQVRIRPINHRRDIVAILDPTGGTL